MSSKMCNCRELMEDLMSGEEASCNSSHLSAKSEKNMADFEGEDVLSEEEELAHINAHASHEHSHDHVGPFPRGSGGAGGGDSGGGGGGGRHPMQQQLANMASLYHKHIPKGQ